MASPPRVCALLFCDRVQPDNSTGKTTIFGVFDRVMSTAFPSQQPEFGVYFNLTGMNGEYQFSLQISVLEEDDAGAEKILLDVPFPQKFKSVDPLRRLVSGINVNGMVWPRAGRYTLRLLYNGKTADEATLVVEQKA